MNLVSLIRNYEEAVRPLYALAAYRYARQLEIHFALGGRASEVPELVTDLAEVFAVGAEGKVVS